MEKLLRTFFMCMFFVGINTAVFAQQRIIKGTVIDETGMAMPGVTVKVKGTTIGTQTTSDGKYSISAPSVNSVLVFSFIGYEQREALPKSTTVNISMVAKASSLNEVVVVAFGTQKKANVTGAIGSVSGKDLVATPVSNVSNMLVGQIAGVTSLQTSGEPGQNGSTIHIRGIATFSTGNNASDPLVVIDGIEQATETGFTQLNNMDANEIASISVLKDATSTAVYGIRAANGVIVVTTKRGKASKPQISLSTNFGFTTTANLQKDVTSFEYATMRNEAVNTSIKDLGNTAYNSFIYTPDDLWKFQHNRDYTPEEVAAMTNLTDEQRAQLNASPALYYGSHDIYRDIFGGKGPQNQLNLNISGGTEKVKYFTSIGSFSQGSIMQNTTYHGANTGSRLQRYNFRSNFDIQATKNIQVAINVSAQFGTAVGAGGNGNTTSLQNRYQTMMQYIYDGNPYVQPGIIDGHLINEIAGVRGSADNPLGIRTGSQIGAQNAVYNLLVSGTQTAYNTLLSNSIKVTHTMDYLTSGLSVHATAGFDENYTNGVSFNPSLPVYSVRRNPTNPNNLDFYGGGIGANGFNSSLTSYNSTWHKSYFDAGFDYARTFGDHAVTALLLGKANTFSLPSDNNNTPSGVIGFLARATYNYKERYLVEYDMGYNGTAQFIEGKRFGFFPAYSAAWVASNESFFPKNNIVTFLKVRGSTGQVGNDNIGGRRYLYFPNSYSQNLGNSNSNQGYYLGSSNGSVQNPYYAGTSEGAIGNAAVTWERSTKTNIGLDARFLSDKISLTADVFKEDRNNILTTLGTIPTTYGVSDSNVPPVNVGVTTNHGYEITLGYTDKVGKLGYNISSYVAYYKNKIVYKAEAPNPYYWQNETGFLINQNFGLVSDGFFNNPQELANRPYNSFTNNQAVLGDIRYKDLNGDGLIDNKDQAPIGFARDPLYSYNLKVSLNYAGFDVSALITGTANGSFYLSPGLTIPFFKQAGNAWQWEYDGRWTPEKAASGAPITFPRSTIDNSPGSNDYLTSDFWLISNSFKRIKNVEVGYTFPTNSFFRRAKISSIRIYANGNNLFTWDAPLKKYGIDPETSDVAGTFIFPITRVFNFGANIRF